MAKRKLGTPKTAKDVAVNLRMPQGMSVAIVEATEKYPIEFRHSADFIRYCIKKELKERKLI